MFDGVVCLSSSGGLPAGVSEGIPLCYISLLILTVILVLFIKRFVVITINNAVFH